MTTLATDTLPEAWETTAMQGEQKRSYVKHGNPFDASDIICEIRHLLDEGKVQVWAHDDEFERELGDVPYVKLVLLMRYHNRIVKP